jgi:hypothetical protein
VIAQPVRLLQDAIPHSKSIEHGRLNETIGRLGGTADAFPAVAPTGYGLCEGLRRGIADRRGRETRADKRLGPAIGLAGLILTDEHVTNVVLQRVVDGRRTAAFRAGFAGRRRLHGRARMVVELLKGAGSIAGQRIARVVIHSVTRLNQTRPERELKEILAHHARVRFRRSCEAILDAVFRDRSNDRPAVRPITALLRIPTSRLHVQLGRQRRAHRKRGRGDGRTTGGP